MADKSSQLLLGALSRAAAEPAGMPLHGTRAASGMFPATTLGKQTAQRCLLDGYLRVLDPTGQPSAKPASDAYVITEKGLSYLAQPANPRQVLEDLVRVLETREVQTTELLQVAGQMRTDIQQLKASTERVLQQVPRTESFTAAFAAPVIPNGTESRFQAHPSRSAPTAENVAALHRAILSNLSRWDEAGASEDYPLAELFRHLQAAVPGLTIGRFHDALRDLHDADRLYLHPWTGPLYDLPEPAFALLVGHLIAYYASSRPGQEAAADIPAAEETGTATVLRFPVR